MAGHEPTGMGRYTKGAILGEGTFGVVFKATDTVVRTPLSSLKACVSCQPPDTSARVCRPTRLWP
jgi:hypothetical protein